jgi:ATP-dependent DNA ligase
MNEARAGSPTAAGAGPGVVALARAQQAFTRCRPLACLGALLVGYFENEDLVFAGKVGTGFDTKLLLELRARLDSLEVPASPFTKAVGLPRVRAHWVRPEVVVRAAFIEWTVHGKLRHSRLLGIRTDKSAREVVREAP